MNAKSMTEKQIIAEWDRLATLADDPNISDAEHESRTAAARAHATASPRHVAAIKAAYAREFPDGPPPSTPGMTDYQRQRIVEHIVRPEQRRRNSVHVQQPPLRRGRTPVNQSQIISAFVRAATWQLMRRSPTWILVLVVAAAWLFAGHH